MSIVKQSLLTRIPAGLPRELTQCLCRSKHVRIERIVSRGHASPEGFWYDQDTDEFVLLVRGSAALAFQGKRKTIVMKPGDWVDIKARTRHRVAWTARDEDTIWLAVYYRKGRPANAGRIQSRTRRPA